MGCYTLIIVRPLTKSDSMAFWKHGTTNKDERERYTKVAPQIEQVRKRYASGYPRLLTKSAERALRAEFTRVIGMKAAEHADWVVLWHEPSFSFVKEVEIRKTVGSTHEIKRGEILYIAPEPEDSFDPYALRAIDGDGEEAGFLSMHDEKARQQSWEALINGKIVVAIGKQNRKSAAALFVYEG